MMGWAGEAAQVGEDESAGMRDEFPVSHRSRNTLEQSDGEGGTAAGPGGCEQPDVAHRGQWGGH